MIDYLLIALVFVAVIQPTSQGKVAALLFAGLTVVFDLIRIPDDFYHLSAAATDGICVLLLSKIPNKKALVFDLQRLCLLSIAINFAGWVCYEAYLSSAPYNQAFEFYYMLAIATILLRGLWDAHSTTATNRPWVPLYFHSNHTSNRGREGGTKS